MKSKLIRQGDVLLEPVFFDIENYEEIPPTGERVILAYGESTGHSHSVYAKDAIMVKIGDKTFLIIKKQTNLEHQEHASIFLPAGNYEVTIQREYSPEGIRNVQD